MVANLNESLFYTFYKDYGCNPTYVTIGKGEINHDTGFRTSAETSKVVKAVRSPVDIVSVFLAKLVGKIEQSKTWFMLLKSEVPVIQTEDYLILDGKKYRNFMFDDLIDVWMVGGDYYE